MQGLGVQDHAGPLNLWLRAEAETGPGQGHQGERGIFEDALEDPEGDLNIPPILKSKAGRSQTLSVYLNS